MATLCICLTIALTFVFQTSEETIDPASVWRAVEDAAPYALGVLFGLHTLAHTLQAAARALQRWTAYTRAAWDDRAAGRLVRWADGFARALDFLAMFLPRIGFGRRSGPGPGSGAVVVFLALALASSTSACGSSAAAAITPQLVPQAVYQVFDAHDGGTITVGGEAWQDARSGGAASEATQSGTEIEADVPIDVAVPISTGGGATTAPPAQPR